MYYYEGLTMREIGEIMELTESRVCQIHSNVMSRLGRCRRPSAKTSIDRGMTVLRGALDKARYAGHAFVLDHVRPGRRDHPLGLS